MRLTMWERVHVGGRYSLDRLSRLDPLDRRVYDMAVSRAPLAQIAVQLGVTVSQAEERIERVCARLGVPDRAALREWAGVLLLWHYQVVSARHGPTLLFFRGDSSHYPAQPA